MQFGSKVRDKRNITKSQIFKGLLYFLYRSEPIFSDLIFPGILH